MTGIIKKAKIGITEHTVNLLTKTSATIMDGWRPKYLVIARHGERLDRALEQQFSAANQQYDHIMWKKMCKRPQDPSLSMLGRKQAKALGSALKTIGLKVARIFSSPLIRCVQTGDLAAQSLEVAEHIPFICIEEGLCEECCSMRYPTVPYLLGKFDLCGTSTRISLDYEPVVRVVHEDMSLERERQRKIKAVRDLSAMNKKMILNDNEEHFVREICEELPNPFSVEDAEK